MERDVGLSPDRRRRGPEDSYSFWFALQGDMAIPVTIGRGEPTTLPEEGLVRHLERKQSCITAITSRQSRKPGSQKTPMSSDCCLSPKGGLKYIARRRCTMYGTPPRPVYHERDATTSESACDGRLGATSMASVGWSSPLDGRTQRRHPDEPAGLGRSRQEVDSSNLPPSRVYQISFSSPSRMGVKRDLPPDDCHRRILVRVLARRATTRFFPARTLPIDST